MQDCPFYFASNMVERSQMSAVVKAKAEAGGDSAESAIALAVDLLRSAAARQTDAERRQAARLQGLITDPKAKAFSMALTDRLFRSDRSSRTARAFRALLKRIPPSSGFPALDRLLLHVAARASWLVPAPVIAAMRARLRKESSEVVLPAEPDALQQYLSRRRADRTRVNLNQLGEAILGEGEAIHRLETLEGLLARSDVDYVSVKISAIFSQLNLLAWDATLVTLKERLRRLYRLALKGNKLVNLDMEEYRDLALTLAAFRETLDEPEFANVRAGVVLQAYLPDSWAAQQELTVWAQRRVECGGIPPKLRLVKGANLAMETVEAEMHGWNPAPYGSKAETDANFKRMLEFACQAENAAALRLGVGSHNLLDVALALVLRERHGVAEFVEIEMLEGMADHQGRAVADAAGGLLVYAPIVRKDDFGSALAYLIRRLDENTAPENFLHDLFDLTPESESWARQVERFRRAWADRHAVRSDSRRASLPARAEGGFQNESDTDWTQLRNRSALREVTESWKLPVIPPVEELSPVLERARAAQPAWEDLGHQRRADLLRQCGDLIASRRMEFIAVLRTEGRKAVPDADTEVSELVDFAHYYAETGRPPHGVRARALGLVVIAPPWNFPLAIPGSGVLAALMAGNSVILKPAPETVATAWMLAQALWAAGIPRDVLQFFPCEDGETGRSLITDSWVNVVVLTGAYETARMFQEWRPSLRLFAETSGKNALVVSALADRDLAIKDLVRSAFGHSGQKCSAASLGILEAEVYDDPIFRRQLRDAAASLPVGRSEDPPNVVTPLIRSPGSALGRGLTQLESGEEWLLEPRQIAEDLWTPGIRLGVQSGSWFHQTECFGPVLGLMRANDLNHAIELQNSVAYGLTAGIHTLDEAEAAHWRERVVAGNLYINRAITGAIVQRQPFGGWKRSCIGPGAKAGGPNYVGLFSSFTDADLPDLANARRSFRAAWAEHFAIEHDPTGLRAESNVFRYRPCKGVILRLSAPDPVAEGIARLAAETCGVPLVISHATSESDDAFAARLSTLAERAEFLRTVDTLSDAVLRAAYAAGLNWIPATFSAVGRLELLRWMREQAVATTRHRYGNLIR
jgi:RHH-type transcriptional regulator, proline utilization regulon repressor / proline dehydrogenase / delta 1-pyrroline-5-carboxylate dehydrogenase